jgi:hypothetical protein
MSAPRVAKSAARMDGAMRAALIIFGECRKGVSPAEASSAHGDASERRRGREDDAEERW